MLDGIRVSIIRREALRRAGATRWGPLGRIALATAVLVALQILPARAASQGFGADTPGGTGQPIYRVTSLADSGSGSLRDAVSKGGRYVVFDVAGTISLSSDVRVLGAYVTIDGTTAPSPGITLANQGLDIDGNHADVHDVVVRGIRIRNPANDGIAVEWGAHHVLIENVSIDGCGDGNIDVTRYAHDVTVAWSVFSGCGKNMLIKYEAQRVTLHHNVFVNSQWRNPWISYTTEHTNNLSPDTMVDMRNNLVWGWGDLGGGTGIECGAKANLVNNYFSSPNTTASRQANAIIMKTSCATGGSGGYAHTFGNVSADGLKIDLNSLGNRSTPYAAAFVDTHDACIGARDALAQAGASPLDSIDLGHLSQVSLSCGSSAPTPTPTPEPTPEPEAPTPAPTPEPTPEPTPSEQILSLQIPGKPHDGEESTDGRVEEGNAGIRLGIGRTLAAFRFADLTIPQGATIVSAKLRPYVLRNGSASVSLRWSAEKAGNSPKIVESTRSLSNRAQTSAKVSDNPSAWANGAFAQSPDLAAVVQEVVHLSTWSSGNAMTFFVYDAGSSSYRDVGSYENAAGKAATLEVRWLPSAPTTEPTPAPTAQPTPVPTAEPTPVPTAEPTPVPTAQPTPSEQVLSLQVSGSAHDGEEYMNGRVEEGNAGVRLGSGRTLAAFRFGGLTIPRGAKIVSAKLRPYVLGNGSASVRLRWSAEKAGNSPKIVESTRSLSNRAQTSTKVNDQPAAWSNGTWAESPDLAAIVQEVVNLSDWSSGNAMTFFVDNAKSKSYRDVGSHENAATQAATLEVRWLP